MKPFLYVLLVFLISVLLPFNSCHTPRGLPESGRGGSILYPEDGRIYDQYIGEFIEGYQLAEGWRTDTLNGGFNKTIYRNPYYLRNQFQKEVIGRDHMQFFYFKEGLPLHGYNELVETGLFGTRIFAAHFIRGMANGAVVFKREEGQILAEGEISHGEITGEWTYYNTYPQLFCKRIYCIGRSFPEEMTYFDMHGKPEYYYRYLKDKQLETYKKYEQGILLEEKQRITDTVYPLEWDEQIMLVSKYRKDGSLASRGRVIHRYMKGDRPIGPWDYFDENGEWIKTEEN